MTSEDDLWIGHSGRITVSRRTVSCACGGFIRAETHPDWIERRVKLHRRTKRHRAWWDRVSSSGDWY